MKETIDAHLNAKLTKTAIDEENSWEETWKTYMEYLLAQYEARGENQLISETCAIKYTTNSQDKMFTVPGGMCYAKKA